MQTSSCRNSSLPHPASYLSDSDENTTTEIPSDPKGQLRISFLHLQCNRIHKEIMNACFSVSLHCLKLIKHSILPQDESVLWVCLSLCFSSSITENRRLPPKREISCVKWLFRTKQNIYCMRAQRNTLTQQVVRAFDVTREAVTLRGCVPPGWFSGLERQSIAWQLAWQEWQLHPKGMLCDFRLTLNSPVHPVPPPPSFHSQPGKCERTGHHTMACINTQKHCK